MISGLLLLIVEYILISLLSDPVCEASAACRCVQLCVSCPHGRPWIFDYGRDYASSKSLSGLLKVCVCACVPAHVCKHVCFRIMQHGKSQQLKTCLSLMSPHICVCVSTDNEGYVISRWQTDVQLRN